MKRKDKRVNARGTALQLPEKQWEYINLGVSTRPFNLGRTLRPVVNSKSQKIYTTCRRKITLLCRSNISYQMTT